MNCIYQTYTTYKVVLSFLGGYGSKTAESKLPYGKIFFILFLVALVLDCKVVHNLLHHNDVGGFGAGTAGLPGGFGGTGSKLGYPFGTGQCSDKIDSL